MRSEKNDLFRLSRPGQRRSELPDGMRNPLGQPVRLFRQHPTDRSNRLSMIWIDYFTLIKALPARIVTPRFGTLDFSDANLPVGKIFKKVEAFAPAKRTVKRKA